MGTIRHGDRKTRLGFSRAGDGTSDTAGAAVLCGKTESLAPNDSVPGSSSLNKKRKLFPGPPPASPRARASPPRVHLSPARAQNPLPAPRCLGAKAPPKRADPAVKTEERRARRPQRRGRVDRWTRSAVSGCGNINPLPFRVIEARLCSAHRFSNRSCPVP